jgi:DNA-binding NtrC family response regulator
MLYRSEQTLLGYLPAVEGPGRVEGGSPPAPSATVIRSRNYSLLITDDDQRFRDSLRGIFETEGFQTFLAGSGEEALDIIRDRPVDLALLDQHLPRLTGLETLRIIRQMNALLPVILVTGGSTQQLMREALSAQAFTVIPKPVSRSVVVYTVERALTQYFDALRRATDHDQRDRMP